MIPQLRDLFQRVIHKDHVDNWFVYKSYKFGDTRFSAQELLSETNVDKLKENIKKVIGPYYQSLEVFGTPGLVDEDELTQLILKDKNVYS